MKFEWNFFSSISRAIFSLSAQILLFSYSVIKWSWSQRIQRETDNKQVKWLFHKTQTVELTKLEWWSVFVRKTKREENFALSLNEKPISVTHGYELFTRTSWLRWRIIKYRTAKLQSIKLAYLWT